MGKSTVAVNLAVLLGQGARRTLVCDLDPQGNAADCVDPLRVVGAVERSGAVVVSISQRSPAADGQPPHLLTVEGVVASRLDQAVRLRLPPGVDDSLLVDGQLPRDQALVDHPVS